MTKVASSRNVVLGFSCLIMGLMVGSFAFGGERVNMEAEARDVTRQFMSILLPTLQGALANGGPVEAIEVCSIRAPKIADELGIETGWSIRRVSLNTRNNKKAIPDDWEREMLAIFEAEQPNGTTAQALNKSAVVDGEFRYMQAQLTMPLCLTCHGSNLSSDVSKALRQHYPDDLAIGYGVDEVRGTISLRYRLD
jgi:hypothetical protein